LKATPAKSPSRQISRQRRIVQNLSNEMPNSEGTMFTPVQPKASAVVSDIANTTFVDSVLAGEEHQDVAIDRRPADGAALEVAPG
jgi:hypothetical protein